VALENNAGTLEISYPITLIKKPVILDVKNCSYTFKDEYFARRVFVKTLVIYQANAVVDKIPEGMNGWTEIELEKYTPYCKVRLIVLTD
jgi:hypothetical protein